MTLFEDIERDDDQLMRFAGPVFSYLSRSSHSVSTRKRRHLEECFSRYPAARRTELRARLRSPTGRGDHAAFFELLLQELLSRLERTAEPHPTLTDATRPVF
jgi:hypothetical protein